ncbi:MAG: hypothetical protein ACTMKW_12220, partial [Brevibacterium aurantiacum]
MNASTDHTAQSGIPTQSGAAGYQGQQGYQNPQGQPGQQSQSGQQGQPPQGPGAGANQSYDGTQPYGDTQRYGSTQRYDRGPDNGVGGHSGYPYPGTDTTHGASQADPNSSTATNPYGTPYAQGAGQPGTGSGPGAG